jgi:hypothetical protein
MRINSELRIVEKVFAFPNSEGVPSRLTINNSGDTLYFIKGGVMQVPVNSNELPSQPLISSDGRLLYGLAIDPNTGHIFVSDAKDYVQNGTAYEYNINGSLVRQFTAGRIPGSFCFTKKNAR